MTDTQAQPYRIKLQFEGGQQVLSVEPAMTLNQLEAKAKELLQASHVTLSITSTSGPPSTSVLKLKEEDSLVRDKIPKLSLVQCAAAPDNKEEEEKKSDEQEVDVEEEAAEEPVTKKQKLNNKDDEIVELLESSDEEKGVEDEDDDNEVEVVEVPNPAAVQNKQPANKEPEVVCIDWFNWLEKYKGKLNKQQQNNQMKHIAILGG